jgi:hypothetical protein
MSEVEIFRASLIAKFEDVKSKATKFHELIFFDAVMAIIETHNLEMKEIFNLEWYMLPPVSVPYGTLEDWTQTIATTFNQASAILFQNKLVSASDIDVVKSDIEDFDLNQLQGKRNILKVPNSFRKQFEMLVFFNEDDMTFGNRYDVLFYEGGNDIMVCDNNHYVTIKLINRAYAK